MNTADDSAHQKPFFFLAKRTSDNKQLIVQQYNSAANRLLVSHDLAPQLHHSSLDDSNSNRLGALGMVVMDYAGESDAYQLRTDCFLRPFMKE